MGITVVCELAKLLDHDAVRKTYLNNYRTSFNELFNVRTVRLDDTRMTDKVRIIVIIIKTGRQCKAGRERFTPSESKDPRPKLPTYR